MTITSNYAGDAVVLRVDGRLDAITSPEFEKTCQQCIKPDTRKALLDLEGVEYISSAGLRAILLVGKTIQSVGGVLGFSGLRGTVKDVIEMAGFSALFKVYDSVEAALEPR
ncbi:MAG: STAS domain-containing protein [Acidobacteriales bacterium]|nr:STAS domain-containing protein [Terriglobales bacterium]